MVLSRYVSFATVIFVAAYTGARRGWGCKAGRGSGRDGDVCGILTTGLQNWWRFDSRDAAVRSGLPWVVTGGKAGCEALTEGVAG